MKLSQAWPQPSTSGSNTGQSNGQRVRVRPDPDVMEPEECGSSDDRREDATGLQMSAFVQGGIGQPYDANRDFQDKSRSRADLSGFREPGSFFVQDYGKAAWLYNKECNANFQERMDKKASSGQLKDNTYGGMGRFVTSYMRDYTGVKAPASKLARPMDNLISSTHSIGGLLGRYMDQVPTNRGKVGTSDMSDQQREFMTSNMMDYKGTQGHAAKLTRPRDNLFSSGLVANDYELYRDQSTPSQRGGGTVCSMGRMETSNMRDYRGIQVPAAKLARPRDNLRTGDLHAIDEQPDSGRIAADSALSKGGSQFVSSYTDTYRGVQAKAAKTAKPFDNLRHSTAPVSASTEYRENYQGWLKPGSYWPRSDAIHPTGPRMYMTSYNQEFTGLPGQRTRQMPPAVNLLGSTFRSDIAMQYQGRHRDSTQVRERFEPKLPTTYRKEYRSWENSRRLPIRPRDQISKPRGAFEDTTSYKAEYRPLF